MHLGTKGEMTHLFDPGGKLTIQEAERMVARLKREIEESKTLSELRKALPFQINYPAMRGEEEPYATLQKWLKTVSDERILGLRRGFSKQIPHLLSSFNKKLGELERADKLSA